jgi:hypothetical protein
MLAVVASARTSGLAHRIRNECISFSTAATERALDLMAEYDICQRCMLRMVGVRDKLLHANIEKAYSIPSKRSIEEDGFTCTVCVGLLQMDYSQIANDAVALLHNYDLKNKAFSLRMQFPAQLPIRNVSIRKFLEEKISQDVEISEDLPTAIEIREIFRYLVSESFSNASGLKFEVDVTF